MRVLILAVTLASCAAPPMPAPPVVAPVPMSYSCAELRQAGQEYAALPPASQLRRLVDDYGAERRKLRALHRMPDQVCP